MSNAATAIDAPATAHQTYDFAQVDVFAERPLEGKRHSLAASGQQIVIEQGVEMLRPSRIYVCASRDRDRVTDVCVGGRTIPIATGRFFLP